MSAPEMVVVKLRFEYLGSLAETERLLAEIKAITKPKIFNADVHLKEPFRA